MEENEEKTEIKLTLKQKIWLKEYMIDGNETRAALVAYYPDFPYGIAQKDLTDEQTKIYNSASAIGSENLGKLGIPLSSLLDEAGLTDVYLTLKLKENLNAVRLYGKDSIEGMDGMARNKALEIALKAKGKLIDRIDHTIRESVKPKVISDIKENVRTETQTATDNPVS